MSGKSAENTTQGCELATVADESVYPEDSVACGQTPAPAYDVHGVDELLATMRLCDQHKEFLLAEDGITEVEENDDY